ncbi:MAG: hypothetical protein QOG99_722, partial [Frankiales bacterium]|nr:hypothetical protein [Frankiales bacterium]
HGVLRYIGARSRDRTSNGISVSSTFVDDPRLESMATAINSALPWRGGWFFQAKERADGELVLLEIAARIAGTSGVSRARGVNLPLLSVYDALDLDVTVAPNGYAVTVDRALENRFHLALDYDHVYIDLDDLLLHADGRVDPEVVAFCVECHNRGKAVHLLTRHRGDLDTTLARHRLAGLFTSVTWIRDDRPKSEYISSPRSILIDDSFAERDAVRRDLGIAVFDGSMVEALRHDLRGSQS